MHDDLLDQIYEAALEPKLWLEVLQGLAEAVGADMASLAQLDVETGRGSVIGPWVDADALKAYREYYGAINPLVIVKDTKAYARDWKLTVFKDEEWIDRAQLTRSEYFNDFLRPLDREWSMTVRLALRNTEVSSIALYRRGMKGPFSEDEMEAARRIQSHLVRAFRLTRRLASTDVLGAAGAALPGQALFLLDLEARIVSANAAGEAMLECGDHLCTRAGRLTASDHKQGASLDALVRRAASPDRGLRRGGAMMVTAADRPDRLAVIVAPVRSERSLLFPDLPSVLVTVSDPAMEPTVQRARLRDTFSLTESEARVALALAEGLSVAEIASSSGVTVKTVRVQLSSVFSKTNTQRQGELVSLLSRAGLKSPV